MPATTRNQQIDDTDMIQWLARRLGGCTTSVWLELGLDPNLTDLREAIRRAMERGL